MYTHRHFLFVVEGVSGVDQEALLSRPALAVVWQNLVEMLVALADSLCSTRLYLLYRALAALPLPQLSSVPLPSQASAVWPSLVVQPRVHQRLARRLGYVWAGVRRSKGLSASIAVQTGVREQPQHGCFCPVPCLPILSVVISPGSIVDSRGTTHHLTEPRFTRSSRAACVGLLWTPAALCDVLKAISHVGACR